MADGAQQPVSAARSAHPRFSIITPTYNRAHLLPRCLDSILGQSFGNFVATVVDDGSTDDTSQVVQSYAQRDARIRYLSQKNRGATAARNTGARSSHGEYLVFLDSDDEVRPQWLERFHSLIGRTNADVACCGVDNVDGQGRLLESRRPKEDLTGSARGGLYLSGNFAIRRYLFSELGGYVEHLPAHQHSELRFRLFDLCERRKYRIVSIPDCLVRVYKHDGPKIRRDPAAKLEATKYILARHRDRFQKKQSIAAWLAAAGGCAGELHQYRESRHFFAEAIRVYPRHWKNYVRYLVALLPGIRRILWRDIGNNRSEQSIHDS